MPCLRQMTRPPPHRRGASGNEIHAGVVLRVRPSHWNQQRLLSRRPVMKSTSRSKVQLPDCGRVVSVSPWPEPCGEDTPSQPMRRPNTENNTGMHFIGTCPLMKVVEAAETSGIKFSTNPLFIFQPCIRACDSWFLEALCRNT